MNTIFHIGEVPQELVWLIVAKCPVETYTKLHRTCKPFLNFLLTRKNLVPLEISTLQIEQGKRGEKITVIIQTNPNVSPCCIDYNEHQMELHCFKLYGSTLIIDFPVYSGAISKILQIMTETMFTCEQMFISSDLTSENTSQEELRGLINMTRVQLLHVRQFVTKDVLPPILLNKVEKVYLLNTDYGEQELLCMKQSIITARCSGVTSAGLNNLLHNWYYEERDIESLHITTSSSLSEESVVFGLPASLLYNVASHQVSVLSALSVNAGLTALTRSFYVLWKSSKISEKFILIISRNSVKLYHVEDPVSFLFKELPDWDYLLVTGFCRYCQFPREECVCVD